MCFAARAHPCASSLLQEPQLVVDRRAQELCPRYDDGAQAFDRALELDRDAAGSFDALHAPEHPRSIDTRVETDTVITARLQPLSAPPAAYYPVQYERAVGIPVQHEISEANIAPVYRHNDGMVAITQARRHADAAYGKAYGSPRVEQIIDEP